MILRTKKIDNYTTISNVGLNDKNLSWGAKGLLTFLISKPDDWKVYTNYLSMQSKSGNDATKNRLNELIKNKYIFKTQLRNKEGKFLGYEYIISEVPLEKKPIVGFPLTENHSLLNTDIINTEINKNKGVKTPKDESIDSSMISKRKKINISLKKNTSKKKKNILNIENCMPIVKKSLLLFKKIVIPIFPKVKKEGLTDEKEINKVQEIIKFFINDHNKNKFSALNDKWLQEHNIPINKYKDILNKETFINHLDESLKIYSNEYKPDNKSKLPTRLSDFLYNSNRQLKSHFLFYIYNSPKKIEELKLIKDKNPGMTVYYEKNFFKRELSINEKNLLIKECTKIREYYDDCFNREVNLKNGKKKKVRELLYYLDNIGAPLSDLKHFISTHVEWLTSVLCNKERIPHINFMKCNNGFWNGFVAWLKQVYGIDLYLLFDDQKVIELSKFRMRY